jgi:chitinase
VTINGDTTIENDETFFVWLSSVTGATLADGQGIGTIANDDTAAAPGLRIGDATISEGNSGTKLLSFNVTLTAAAANAVTFNASTQGNTATAGVDFASLPVTGFSIPAGQLSTTVTVTVNGDTVLENDEAFYVWLSSVSGATLLDGQGVGTIANDDTPGLRINDATITEGNSGTKLLAFTVTLTQAAANTVTFNASTQGNTAAPGSDFVGFGVTPFSIPAGQTTKIVNVTINGDTTVEANEAFFVWLSSVSGATLQDGQGIGTIGNDD